MARCGYGFPHTEPMDTYIHRRIHTRIHPGGTVKGVIVAAIGAVLTALVFFAGTRSDDGKKVAEAPRPEVVDGVELDREIDIWVGSTWSPAIKLPYGTCILVWVPRGEEIGIKARSSTKGFAWMDLSEWEHKYSHYGHWDLISFLAMTSHGTHGTHVKYRFSKKPINRGCSFLTRNGALRTYEDIEQDQVMTKALSIVPGRATDFDPMGYPCVEDNLTPEDLQQVRKVLGTRVTYTASLSARRAEKTVWFYEDSGKGCDVAYRRYRERGLIGQ